MAQIDTLQILSYFPLQIGNRWQFEEITRIDTSVDISYRTITVIGDTIMPNGKTYRILENDWRYFRVDTSELKVYLYYPHSFGGTCPDSEVVYFDLVYPDSGRFTTCEGYSVQVDTGTGSIGHISDTAQYIDYFWYYGMTNYIKLSRGIGISEWWYWELGGTEGRLVAAIVDSVQYGQFVGIEQPDPVPHQIRLFQNYPNPFNPVTNVEFRLPNAEWVKLEIYDLLGRRVKTLVNKRLTAGRYTLRWDGTDDRNMRVESGVYFYRLSAGPFVQTRKMLLIR